MNKESIEKKLKELTADTPRLLMEAFESFEIEYQESSFTHVNVCLDGSLVLNYCLGDCWVVGEIHLELMDTAEREGSFSYIMQAKDRKGHTKFIYFEGESILGTITGGKLTKSEYVT